MKRMPFLSDKRGVIAVAFGLMFPVMIAAMGVGYDLSQAYMARSRLTQALDAAGLAAAGSTVSVPQSSRVAPTRPRSARRCSGAEAHVRTTVCGCDSGP